MILVHRALCPIVILRINASAPLEQGWLDHKMMPRPRQAAASLPESGFSVRDALAANATRGSLRHPSYLAPYYGVRCTSPEVPPNAHLRERILQAAMRLLPRLRSGEAVSHSSALVLHGCPIRTGRILHVSSQPTHARNRTRGAQGHRLSHSFPVGYVEGVPVVLPTTAILQSASQLPLRELIVAIDHCLRPRRPSREALVTLDELRVEAERFRGRGAQKLRVAVTLARIGAESRMETITRLVLLAYGLASQFELQVDLSDGDGWIGRFDLVNRARKVLVEYDGDQHRTDKAQYAKDLRRLDRARALGYTVIRLLSEDVLHRPGETAIRVAASLRMTPMPHTLQRSLLACDSESHPRGRTSPIQGK